MSLLGKFATVGGATFTSRVLGLAREIMMAATLAAGPVADVFYTCFRLPNLFRAMFAEGAFNIAFVPMFAKELEKGTKDAKKLGSEIFAVLISWLIVFTAAAIIFMPFIITNILAPGFNDTPEKMNLAIVMSRIMFPYLMFMSLAAMLAGILNCLQRYFIAAIAPVILNIVLIAVLAGIKIIEMDNNKIVGICLAGAVFLAGALQMSFLFFALKKEKMIFKLITPKLTPKVKKLMILMAPAILTGGVLQINLLIGTIIATTQDGANALINYADRLNQLPIGVVGVAVGVVLLPELTRALNSGNANAENLQNRAIEFAMMCAVPASIGLIMMPEEIVRIVYQRGVFTAETTKNVANILWVFATGLPAYITIKAIQPAFFARGDMKNPLLMAAIMVIINITLSIMLFPKYGPVAIAVATSIAAWVHLIIATFAIAIKYQFKPQQMCINRIARTIIATAIMGAAIIIAKDMGQSMLENQLFFKQLIALSGIIVLAVGVYGISLAIMAKIIGDQSIIEQIKLSIKKNT